MESTDAPEILPSSPYDARYIGRSKIKPLKSYTSTEENPLQVEMFPDSKGCEYDGVEF